MVRSVEVVQGRGTCSCLRNLDRACGGGGADACILGHSDVCLVGWAQIVALQTRQWW